MLSVLTELKPDDVIGRSLIGVSQKNERGSSLDFRWTFYCLDSGLTISLNILTLEECDKNLEVEATSIEVEDEWKKRVFGVPIHDVLDPVDGDDDLPCALKLTNGLIVFDLWNREVLGPLGIQVYEGDLPWKTKRFWD